MPSFLAYRPGLLSHLGSILIQIVPKMLENAGKIIKNGMEWVPMPPFGLILCENLPTGVRMPMECLKHQKNKFFHVFLTFPKK